VRFGKRSSGWLNGDKILPCLCGGGASGGSAKVGRWILAREGHPTGREVLGGAAA
jgi:hypothetical protein